MPSKILLVEDDKNINDVVCENLKEAGYVVASFENGLSAQNYITSNNDIDLYIFDIMLPGLSGLELLKTVRLKNQIPVAMLTAMDDEDTQLMSFDFLADDYITKPFSPKLLVKRVSALLRRTKKSEEILTIGQLTLNSNRYEVSESGKTIALTLREFELLYALLREKGRVLTRQQLLNLVWGYDYYGDERIVNVHIKNIRKKLNQDPITTVLGVGYKINLGLDDANE